MTNARGCGIIIAGENPASVRKEPYSTVIRLLLFIYTYAAWLLGTVVPLAPETGDINVMIVVAMILIAAFMIFILLKSRRPRQ